MNVFLVSRLLRNSLIESNQNCPQHLIHFINLKISLFSQVKIMGVTLFGTREEKSNNVKLRVELIICIGLFVQTYVIFTVTLFITGYFVLIL